MTYEQINQWLDSLHAGSPLIYIDFHTLNENEIQQFRLKLLGKIQTFINQPGHDNLVQYLFSLGNQSYPNTAVLYPSAYQAQEAPAQSTEASTVIDTLKRMTDDVSKSKPASFNQNLSPLDYQEILTYLNQSDAGVPHFLNILKAATPDNIHLFLEWIKQITLDQKILAKDLETLLSQQEPAPNKTNVIATIFNHENEILSVLLLNSLTTLIKDEKLMASFVAGLLQSESLTKQAKLNSATLVQALQANIVPLLTDKTSIKTTLQLKKPSKECISTYMHLIHLIHLYSAFHFIKDYKTLTAIFPKREALVKAILELPRQFQLPCLQEAMKVDSPLFQYIFKDKLSSDKIKQAIFNNYAALSVTDLSSWLDMIEKHDIVMPKEFFKEFDVSTFSADIQTALILKIFKPGYLHAVINHRHIDCVKTFMDWITNWARHPDVDIEDIVTLKEQIHALSITRKDISEEDKAAFESKLESLCFNERLAVLAWLENPKTYHFYDADAKLPQRTCQEVNKTLSKSKTYPYIAFVEFLFSYARNPHADLNIIVNKILEPAFPSGASIVDEMLIQTHSSLYMRAKNYINFLNLLLNKGKIQELARILEHRTTLTNYSLLDSLFGLHSKSLDHANDVITMLKVLASDKANHPLLNQLWLNLPLTHHNFLHDLVLIRNTEVIISVFDMLEKFVTADFISIETIKICLSNVDPDNNPGDAIQTLLDKYLPDNVTVQNKYKLLLRTIETKAHAPSAPLADSVIEQPRPGQLMAQNGFHAAPPPAFAPVVVEETQETYKPE